LATTVSSQKHPFFSWSNSCRN